jgi:hypothetical protein
MTSRVYTHPHPDPSHVMRVYRAHILKCKRKWGTARGLIHYRALIEEYLAAKWITNPARHE